jgi:hypothetical protein
VQQVSAARRRRDRRSTGGLHVEQLDRSPVERRVELDVAGHEAVVAGDPVVARPAVDLGLADVEQRVADPLTVDEAVVRRATADEVVVGVLTEDGLVAAPPST